MVLCPCCSLFFPLTLLLLPLTRFFYPKLIPPFPYPGSLRSGFARV